MISTSLNSMALDADDRKATPNLFRIAQPGRHFFLDLHRSWRQDWRRGGSSSGTILEVPIAE